jgi:hypothetical protein
MDTREQLRRIVDEAVMLQGLADDILAGVRARRSLAELARPGGALVSRFVALRAQLPATSDPRLNVVARTVGETLDHHAMMVASSLDLLGDLRPERVAHLIDTLDGLGPPAQRLCALQAELAGEGMPRPRARQPI